MKKLSLICLISCYCLMSYGVIKEKTSYVGSEDEATFPIIPEKTEATVAQTINQPPVNSNQRTQAKPDVATRQSAVESRLKESEQKAKKIEKSVSTSDREMSRLQTDLETERDKNRRQQVELIKMQTENEQLGGRQPLVRDVPRVTIPPIYTRESVVDEPKAEDRLELREIRTERRREGRRPKVAVVREPVYVRERVVESVQPDKQGELQQLRRENEELRSKLGE